MFPNFFPSSLAFVLIVTLWDCNGGKITTGDIFSGSEMLAENTGVQQGPKFFLDPVIITSWLTSSIKGKLSSNPDDIVFYLYSNPMDKNFAQIVTYKDKRSLQAATIRPNAPCKFLIHGFTQNRNGSFPQNVKDAYLQRMKDGKSNGYNIFVVDWGMLAQSMEETYLPDYTAAVQNVPVVGNRIGEFISFLMENGVIPDLKSVHLLGFSLGSHVAGSAGSKLASLYKTKVGRISGLDPAGPEYYSDKLSAKLKNDDADFIDVYHTSQGFYGIWDSSIGHVKFSPNGGGPTQPYCLNVVETNNLIEVCSHGLAPEFYAYSINTNYTAQRCESYIKYNLGICNGTNTFGEFVNSDVSHRGQYYLNIEVKGEDNFIKKILPKLKLPF